MMHDRPSPRTEAGKRLAGDLDDFEGWDPTIVAGIIEVENEARAEAESRSALTDGTVQGHIAALLFGLVPDEVFDAVMAAMPVRAAPQSPRPVEDHTT